MIIDLRDQNKTYDEIAAILNCAKSTVSYHCNPEVREKAQARQGLYNRSITRRLVGFKTRATGDHRVDHIRASPTLYEYNMKDVLEKIGPEPKCALTGKPIVLSDVSTWTFDHIVPVSKGGTNDLSNMQLVTKDVNSAKGQLLVSEFIELCKQVVNYNQ